MLRMLLGGLATTATALALAASAGAATINVTIKSTGFSPATLTVNHGDRVTFRNADKHSHQVVADDGSFASPILHPNQTWTATLNNAGTFHFRDALSPSHTGKVTVKGPPPSVTLALDVPIVDFGTQINLSGAISTGQSNESVEIDAQPWGQASAQQLTVLKTGTNGAFSFAVTPSIYTTYVARWNRVASGSVVAQVQPKLHLLVGGKGYMKATVAAPISMWHKHVYLQRLSAFGQWVNVAALTLGQANGIVFKPVNYLPKGQSHIRVFLSVNQAGNGLLAGHSGTQTINKKTK